VLHARNIILTVAIDDIPHVPAAERTSVSDLGDDFWRIVLRYGFMDGIDVPADLAKVEGCGGGFRMLETSFYLGRETLISSIHPGMSGWREQLFALMMRNAEPTMAYFKLPINRVVELGSQVAI